MHPSMHRNERGSFVYYTCDRLPVRHAFTTKFGGVSRGDCESLNLGFNRGDERENVLENYRILAEQLGMDEGRITMTKQIHDTQISVVTEGEAGMGLHQPMAWESDAIVTALPETPLCGFYADCVVTLFYDPATQTAGVAHAGWRGMAAGILPKTVEVMAEKLGAKRESLIAVLVHPSGVLRDRRGRSRGDGAPDGRARASVYRGKGRQVPCRPAGHRRQTADRRRTFAGKRHRQRHLHEMLCG